VLGWVCCTAFTYPFTAGKGCQSCGCAPSSLPVSRGRGLEVDCPYFLVGYGSYFGRSWWKYVEVIFSCSNAGDERLPVGCPFFHRFMCTCCCCPGEELLDTHSLFPGQVMCVKPPHFLRDPIKHYLWAVGVFVVVAPSTEFGIHCPEGIEFRDVVIAGYFQEFS